MMSNHTEIEKDHAILRVSRFTGVDEVLVAIHNLALDERGAIYLTPQESVTLGSHLLNLGRKMMEEER